MVYSSRKLTLKVILRLVLLLGVVCFFTIGAAENNGGRRMKISLLNFRSGGNVKHDDGHYMIMRREKKHRALSKSDDDHMNHYYASKRRVPNGPDPVHNRRAGNTRLPPGRQA